MKLFGKGEPMRGRTLNWAVTAASCQAFLLLGYDQGVMSGIIGAQNNFASQFNNPDPNMQGIITSIYDIGCAAGCLFAFFFGESIGRRWMIIMGGSTMILGTILLGTSYSVGQFLVGRIVTGIGNGFNSATVPMYQSEMCPPKNRGRLLSAQGTVTIIGLCIAYWLDFGLSYASGPVQWRLPISFQAFFAIALVLQMWPLPETPRYLVEKGRIEEATAILARLEMDTTATPSSPSIEFQLAQIQQSLEIESAGGPFRYQELFQGGKLQNWRRMVLCGAINVMQQFTGANMINYYAPVIYQQTLGFSRELSLILGGCTSLTYLGASFIPLWTVDRFGRRALLIFSAAGLCFCFSMVSILLSVDTKNSGAAAAAFIFIFQIFLGIGWLPVPWFYPSEVTTTRIRSRGQAFGGFINWMCVFTVVQITPIAISNISWHTFIIFAVFCALWVPIVYCFFPETNGLRLEDIDHLFDKGGITGGVWGSKGGRTVDSSRSMDWEADGKDNEKSDTLGFEQKEHAGAAYTARI